MTSAEPMALELENIKAGTKLKSEIMTLIPQETSTRRIYAAASRPWMFLTSDVYSRYGLEAMGQARCGPWEKQQPQERKSPLPAPAFIAKDVIPESSYWYQGHKNPLTCHCQSTFMLLSLDHQNSSSGSCFNLLLGEAASEMDPVTPTSWYSHPCMTHSH